MGEFYEDFENKVEKVKIMVVILPFMY